MQIWEMKQEILKRYKNASSAWKYKVTRLMSDNQIIAIYYSILRREEKEHKNKELDKKYHQMTIFEWMEANKDVTI